MTQQNLRVEALGAPSFNSETVGILQCLLAIPERMVGQIMLATKIKHLYKLPRLGQWGK